MCDMEASAPILLPKYDPRDPRTIDDPYVTYADLRRAGPLCRAFGPGHWAVTRYADIAALLGDPRLGMEFTDTYHGVQEGPLAEFFRRIIFERDPPAHTRLRHLIGQAFDSGFFRRLHDRTAVRVDALLDPLLERGRFDAVADLAVQVPMWSSGELLGIPAADLPPFHAHESLLAKSIDMRHLPGQDYSGAEQSLTWLRAYLEPLVAARRRQPGDDLLSRMASAEHQGERLTDAEIVDNAIFIFFAGLDTSKDLISIGCAALLQFPDAWVRLRADRSLVHLAVEEFLRYDAPIQALGRRVLEPIPIAGHVLRQGRIVWLLLGSANHDERQFSDPDRVNVARKPNPHVTFGMGAHHCLAAPLARAGAAMVFRRLVDRCATLDTEGPPVRRPSALFRSYESIPLRVTSV